MIRQPVAAGRFYSGDKEELSADIAKCFKRMTSKKRDILGGIAPHAGYMYSGPCAAYLYNCLKTDFKTVMILGFSHMGIGSGLSISTCDWSTPLGIVEHDNKLAKILSRFINIDENPHTDEHSIEVQLPFLQYVLKKFRMLAVSVSDYSPADVKGIAELIRDKKICVIASTDFTHFGPSFGYTPFADNIRENLEELDKGAIQMILDKNSAGFMEYLKKTGATVCGRAPVAFMIELMNELGAEPDLLKYCTSGDIAGDYTNSVSYVSVAYDKK